MSETTSESSKQPGNGSPTSSERRTPASTPSLSVRDYLYFDQSKVLSYLSQIQGGLQLLVEQVERQFRTDDATTPEQRRQVEATIQAELMGKIPLLADASVQGEYKSTRETKTGGDKTSTGRVGQKATVSTVHHEALELIERNLGSRLVKITGAVQFIDFDTFLDSVISFPDFTKNFNAATGQKVGVPPNMKNIHYLVSKSSAGRILVLLKDASSIVTSSYLSRNFLTSDPQSIVDNYGMRFSVPFTLIGVESTPSEKEDFSASFNQAHEDGLDMGKGLIDVFQSNEMMKSFWELRSKDRHLYPIALYRDL